ncbi:MAG TPA: hypothetical protein VGD58_31720 [Herpetosiphonaceae bacterium]
MHQSLSPEVVTNPVPQGVQGQRGLGYVKPEDLQLAADQRPQNAEFRLTSTTSFNPFLVLLNNTEAPKTILLTTVLDYRQVSFTLDNQDGLLHLVTIPAHSEVNIPLRLTIAEPGRHDLYVVAFEDPFNLSLSIRDRNDTYGKAFSRRTTVVVGDSDAPTRVLDVADIGAIPSPKGQLSLHIMFVQRPADSTAIVSPPERNLVYTDTVSLGQPYPLQMVVTANHEAKAGVHAIVPFLNYHQVPVNGQDVLALRLEADEEAVINADIALPDEAGVHQLQMVYLIDPYSDLLTETDVYPFVQSSFRIAIVAQEP